MHETLSATYHSLLRLRFLRAVIGVALMIVAVVLPHSAKAEQHAVSQDVMQREVHLAEDFIGSSDSLINIICSQTDVLISYSNRVYANSRIHIYKGMLTLREALNEVFSRLPVDYVARGRKIIVVPRKTSYFHLSGYCRDAASGEVLIGANVYDTTLYVGAVTNDYGFFSINLPEGRLSLRSSFVGYKQLTQVVELQRDTFIDIRLEPMLRLDDVYVVADVASSTKTGAVELPMEQVKNMPLLFGASDVIRAMMMTPGVQSGEEGFGGMSVRGGAVDENVVLLDDVPLYNPNHLLGLFTVFNSEGVNSATLIKSGFPARYGGRMSSVLDVKTHEGHMSRYSGLVNISPVSANLQFEGPIWKERMSFAVSARRTFFDLFSGALTFGGNNKYSFYFYDITSKWNYIISPSDRVYVSFFTGYDKFYYLYNFRDVTLPDVDEQLQTLQLNDEQQVYWGNLLVSARWNHVYGRSLFSNMTLSYSNYRFNNKTLTTSVSDASQLQYRHHYFSGIRDFAWRMDFSWYTSAVPGVVRFGASTTYHHFYPGISVYATDAVVMGDSISHRMTAKFQRQEAHVYAEDEFRAGRFSANIGAHVSMVHKSSDNISIRLEPRVLVGYQALKYLHCSVAYSDVTQSLQQLKITSIETPADMWLPISSTLPTPHSWQLSAEARIDFWSDFSFTAEAYFKRFKDRQMYKTQSIMSLLASKEWESLYCSGTGDAKGVEFFLHRKTGRVSGWVGYSLSKALNTFAEINAGRTFPSDYDHRHSASFYGLFKISDFVDFSTTWSYRTGSYFTLSNNRYTIEGYDGELDEFNIEGERNAYQMQASHMLNAGMNFRRSRGRTERVLSFGVYNVYGRKNPMLVYWSPQTDSADTQEHTTYKLKQFSLIAWPWPYIKYSIRF